MILLGSFTSGQICISRSQSDSSRRTHRSCDREKNNPGLQVLSTGVPSKHKKYRVHEKGLATFETPLEGQTISLGFKVVVDKVVVERVVVVGVVGGLIKNELIEEIN